MPIWVAERGIVHVMPPPIHGGPKLPHSLLSQVGGEQDLYDVRHSLTSLRSAQGRSWWPPSTKCASTPKRAAEAAERAEEGHPTPTP